MKTCKIDGFDYKQKFPVCYFSKKSLGSVVSKDI